MGKNKIIINNCKQIRITFLFSMDTPNRLSFGDELKLEYHKLILIRECSESFSVFSRPATSNIFKESITISDLYGIFPDGKISYKLLTTENTWALYNMLVEKAVEGVNNSSETRNIACLIEADKFKKKIRNQILKNPSGKLKMSCSIPKSESFPGKHLDINFTRSSEGFWYDDEEEWLIPPMSRRLSHDGSDIAPIPLSDDVVRYSDDDMIIFISNCFDVDVCGNYDLFRRAAMENAAGKLAGFGEPWLKK